MTARPELGHDLENARVEFRALGPLTAFSGETRIGLGGKRQRLVLAVLLAHANRHLSQDALIDAVWNGVMPESGARSLHTYVSLLRKALGGGIERQGDGYVLEVQPEHFDVFRFESLLTEARAHSRTEPAMAAQLLRQGLGLWTGTAYGDLGLEPALSDEAALLAKDRISALELRFEMDLQLGRHEQIVPEIEALLQEEPYREHLAWMLMIALYRSGRQAEALRVYSGIRETLVEELGIDPGQELQDLELKILERNPELQAAPVDLTSDEVHGARGYEVHEPIGRTEFGARFRGFHGTMAREVSVLVIDPGLANEHRFVRNFEAGMQAVSQIEHPNLAPVLDYWRDPENAYVITPFYRGGTLEGALADGPLTLATTLRIADQLSAGLGSLHRQGHAHGAITASSVFLDEEHNAYLTDFGLAEARGQELIEVTDDVRQLGTLVEALLGDSEPGRLDLPAELGYAISRALHPQPELRYQRIEDFARALRQSAGLDVMMVPVAAGDVERRNPYKGLRAFQESDAADFHGRDSLIQEMVDALTAARLMAVVGPSGSGKSSVVRAGLLPRLRKGALPGSEEWLITDMFPGTHPFETLAAALLRVASTRPLGLYETLTADSRGLATIVDQLLPPHGTQLLLVIDQFEELFSLVSSTTDRQRFLDALLAATDQSRLRIVLTLRADFFDQPLQYPEFAEIFRSNVVAVSPPTRDGLARAISEPALTAGVSIEPGLVTQIVDDLREQPGGLPLLQFALTDLFARREGDILTIDAYNASGGVGGALANRAEETYASLSPQGKEAAWQLFLRLVTVDELADDTRRRVRQSELLGLDIDRQVMSEVMQQFGALRFLSFDRDPASRAPTVELAHEALLREWQRLKTWIDERREDLLIHRRIQMTVQDWRESGDDRSYLLRGGRLEQALVWLERTDIAVSEEETSLIEASIEAEKEELAERQALEAKAARRRKALIGVLAGGLVVAGVLGAVAMDRANSERVTAARATARDLSAAATAAIEEDPELGVLLSLEAIEATESLGLDPVPEAISAVRTTQLHMRVEHRLEGYQAIGYSPDGELIASDQPGVRDTGVTLFDAATGSRIGDLEDPPVTNGRPSFITFSPSGDTVAVAREYRSTRGDIEASSVTMVDLYDTVTRQHLSSLKGESYFATEPSFSRSGLVAVVDWEDGRPVSVWDPVDGESVETIASATDVLWTEFLPDTDTLVVLHARHDNDEGGVTPNRLSAVDLDTGAESWVFDVPDVDLDQFDISPDGSMVALAGQFSAMVEVRSLPEGEPLFESPHPFPQALAWSHDGLRLAVSGNDADVTIFDIPSRSTHMILTGHRSSVWGLAFSPDDEHIASTSLDGQARVWNVTPAGSGGDWAIDLHATLGWFWLSGETDRLFTTVEGVDTRIVDLKTGEVMTTFPLPHGSFGYLAVIDSDFTTVGGRRVDDHGALFDAATGEEIMSYPECVIPRTLSPGGKLVVLDSQVTCPSDHQSRVVDMENGDTLIDLGRRPIFIGVFSPDADVGAGYLALLVGPEGNDVIEVYSLETRRLVGTFSIRENDDIGFLRLQIDREGRYLAVGTNGPFVVVFDMERVLGGTSMAEAILFRREGHKGNAPVVNVTSDRIAVSVGFDGFHRAWDIENGDLLWEIRLGTMIEAPVNALTRDEGQLAYEAGHGVIRFTPMDSSEVIERAGTAVTRSLTDDECRQYLHTDGCVDEFD